MTKSEREKENEYTAAQYEKATQSRIDWLEGQVYSEALRRRESITVEFIRRGFDGDALINVAEKACSFIESGIPTAKPTKVKKIKVEKTSTKGKRKYTKRSKFWKKK
jgi:hypothetical protein